MLIDVRARRGSRIVLEIDSARDDFFFSEMFLKAVQAAKLLDRETALTQAQIQSLSDTGRIQMSGIAMPTMTNEEDSEEDA